MSCQQVDNDLILYEENPNLKLENGILILNTVPVTGHIVSYYDTGHLKSSTSYFEGRKNGLETYWYKNDTIATERYYSNGLKTKKHSAFWEDGTSKFVYHFSNNGTYHGNVKEWYQTGNIFRDFNYINGKEIGSQKLWYETGKIKANYEVVNGERFGLIGLKKCYKVTVGSNEVK